jgi:TPR repeat protein
MTSPYTKFHLLAITTVLYASLSLLACTEKQEATDKAEIITPAVSQDKIAQLQREADAGDPDAQYNLAYLYENGLGLPKDEEKALELYQKAADQGHSEAVYNLNAMKAAK